MPIPPNPGQLPSPVSVFRYVVSLSAAGVNTTLQDIASFAGASAEQLGQIDRQVSQTVGSINQLTTTLTQVYDLLIQQNERLNANIIRSQAFLATGTRIYGANGDEITNISDKIDASKTQLRNALKDIERDTRDLVGVTSAQVNEAFGIVLRYTDRIVGQSKTRDVVQSAKDITRSFVATLGTIQLPQQQIRQEFEALINGELTNPNAAVARTLNISKTEFNRARDSGQLIDFLIKKMEVFVVANKKGQLSINALGENFTSLFQDVARFAGEPLLDPLISSLNDLYVATIKSEDKIKAFATNAGNEVAQHLGDIIREIGNLLNALKPVGSYLGGDLDKTIGVFLDGIRGITQFLTLATNALVGFFAVTAKFGRLGLLGDELERAGIKAKTLGEQLQVSADLFATLGGGAKKDAEAIGALNAVFIDTATAGLKATTIVAELGKVLAQIQSRGPNAKATAEEEKLIKIYSSKLAVQESLLGNARESAKTTELSISGNRAVRDDLVKGYNERLDYIAKIKAETEKSLKLKPGSLTGEAQYKVRAIPARGSLLQQFQEDLQSAQGTLFGEKKTGDVTLFDQVAQKLPPLIAQLHTLEGITTGDAIKYLNQLRLDPGVKRETLLIASQTLTKVLEEESQKRIAAFKAEQATIDGLVKAGRIDAEQGTVDKLKIDVRSTKIELTNVLQQIQAAKLVGDKGEENKLETRKNELNAKLLGLPGEIADKTFAAQNARLGRAQNLADDRLKQSYAFKQQLLSKDTYDEVSFEEDTAYRKSAIARDQAADELKIAKVKRQQLEQLDKPQSQAEIFQRTRDINAAKLSETQATDKLLQAESSLYEQTKKFYIDRAIRRQTANQTDVEATRANIAQVEAAETDSAENIAKAKSQASRRELESAKIVAEERVRQANKRGPTKSTETERAKAAQELSKNAAQIAQLDISDRDRDRANTQKRIENAALAAETTYALRSAGIAKEIRDETILAEDVKPKQLAIDRDRNIVAETRLKAQLEEAKKVGESLERTAKISQLETELNKNAEQRYQLEKQIVDAKKEQIVAGTERELKLQQLLATVIEKSLQNQLTDLGQLGQILQQQQSLLQARGALMQAKFSLDISSLTLAAETLKYIQSLQQELHDDKTGPNTLATIQQILRERGASTGQTKAEIKEEERLRIAIADAEFNAKTAALKQKEAELELEKQQGELSAKRTQLEAQQGLIKLKLDRQSLEVELAKADLQPKEIRDKVKASLQAQIGLQNDAIGLGEKAVTIADAGVANQQQIAELRTQTLAAQDAQATNEALNARDRAKDSARLDSAKALDQLQGQKTEVAQTIINNTYNFSSAAGSRTAYRQEALQ